MSAHQTLLAEAVAHGLDILEAGFKIPAVQVIKKQATDATLFITML